MITFTFGDSITLGLWDSQGGWADRLKRFILDQEVESNVNDYHYLYNLGIDGNTTQQVVDRFDTEVNSRLWPNETYAFIFATGINDTFHRNDQDFASTPEQFQHQLRLLYQQAHRHSRKICFLDLTPVDESLTNPLAGSTTNMCYTNARIDLFNSALHQFYSKANADLLQINQTFKQYQYPKLLIDGLHPNHHGHQLIYQAVLEVYISYLAA